MLIPSLFVVFDDWADVVLFGKLGGSAEPTQTFRSGVLWLGCLTQSFESVVSVLAEEDVVNETGFGW